MSGVGYHYVAQEYLRGFEVAGQPGMVWAFDKVQATWELLPIKRVAQERGYYDESDEKALSQGVEGPGHRVLADLRGGVTTLTDEDRVALAFYITTMMKRVPRARTRLKDMIPGVLDDIFAEASAEIDAAKQAPGADRERLDFLAAELPRLKKKFTADPPESVVSQVRSPWPNLKWISHVYSMTWRLVPAGEAGRFITSDNPAYFFEGFGLGTPDAEMTVPLSSGVVLHGCYQGPRSGLIAEGLAKPGFVKECNGRLASGAQRFVYGAEPFWFVEKLVRKRSIELNRIRWEPRPEGLLWS